MELLNALLNGDLNWRNQNWLWALLLPLLLGLIKRLNQQKQKQSYADAHLWPWVAASKHTRNDTRLEKSLLDNKPINSAPRKMIKKLSFLFKKLQRFIISPSRLISLAWICLIIALAGPRSFISAPDIQSREGVDILVSMDLSHSMTAEDTYPNRFLFAKSLVESMANQLGKEDRLALQAFSGQGHMVSPLSYDRSLFQHALNLLEPNLLPLQGSWLEQAVIGGLSHLSQTAGKAQVMVIFTNGAPEFWQSVNLPESIQQSPFVRAQKLSETGVKIVLVGIGLPTATPLPDQTDSTGNLHVNGLLVQSRLEENNLRKTAQKLEGVYLRAEPGPAFMQNLIKEITLPTASRSMAQSNLIWQDYAWPFIVTGFISLLAAFYLLGFMTLNFKGLLTNKNRHSANGFIWLSGFLILSLYSFPQPSYAQSTTSQLTPSLQQAYNAYHAKNYTLAQTLYDQIPNYHGWFGAGSSAYKAGDLEAAVLYFRQAAWSAKSDHERAKSLFNLGNSYYQANLLELAIESYQQALVYQPKYDKAELNLQLTLKRKAIEDRGKTSQKDQEGDEEGSKSRDNKGAFYGGQKPSSSDSKEQGFGSDGDSPQRDQSGNKVILPPTGSETDYSLSSHANTLQLNADGSTASQANIILIQQQQRQRAEAFKHELQQLEDDQKTLLKRLFEREAGFHAPQEKAHPIPGVQPW